MSQPLHGAGREKAALSAILSCGTSYVNINETNPQPGVFNYEKNDWKTSPGPDEMGLGIFGNTCSHRSPVFIVKEAEEVSLCDPDDLGWELSD